MKRISVFCGSSSGTNSIYSEITFELGQTLARRNIGVVFGGGKVGLMGQLADGALDAGGEVIGVLPHFLQQRELAHKKITQLILVNSMHERKKKMDELSNGVIALPGGFGTLEELFEMLTWGQLGLHQKPIGILNIDGYYSSLLSLFESMVENGFLKQENHEMVRVSNSIENLLDKMKDYIAPSVGKWISKDEL